MEFNARYAVTGVFAIAVALGLFAFVYWLENMSGFGERTDYRIRFTVPVSGLARGGDVLFNGLKVGEVTSVGFDPADPGAILATISIMAETPVRQDTEVGVDYQGLTGAANILLTGGAADAARVEGSGGVPLLDADPAASRSWTQNAGRLLGRLDGLLERNSDRFDGILAGLEKLAGGGSSGKSEFVHDLPLPASFPEGLPPATWQIAIAEPTVVLSLNTDNVLEQTGPGMLRALGNAKWTDNLPNLFQAKMLQAFENAGYTGAILRPADAVDPDYRLVLDIRGFVLDTAADPTARLDFVARLVDRDGAVIASQAFETSRPAAGKDEAPAVEAMGGLFAETAAELVKWTVESAPAGG